MEKFLSAFYITISFESGGAFKDELFRNFFLPNAILIENYDGVYKQKTVDEHIEEFNSAIRNHPNLFTRGFHEMQTDCKMIESGNCILVSSSYQKTYSRNNETIVETGVNNMIVVLQDSEYKIASILW